MGAMVAKKLISILFVFSFLTMVAAVNAVTIDVSQPIQLTNNEYYERGQSIIYDGTNYWLFYGRSTEVTGNYGNSDPDTHDYQVYYKTASTISGLVTATPTKLIAPHNSNIYLGETDSAYFGGSVRVYASVDVGNHADLYQWYTNNGGSTWNEGVIESGLADGAAHFAATTCDNKLWFAYQLGNNWKSKYYTTGWSSEYDITVNYGTAKFYCEGNNLYFIRADSGDQDIFTWNGASWTSIDSSTDAGSWDPTIYKVGTNYVAAYAPWVSPKQWIKAKVGSNLFTLLSTGTEVEISSAYYGSNAWIDMWPTGFTDSSGNTYLFYTSERNPTDPNTEITGNIWYLPIEWSVTNDHYTYIQNAIDQASIGNTLNIYDATYSENPIINKGLTVQSNSGYINAIIAANGGTGVQITSNNVILDGFTITNPAGKHGIYAQDHSNLLIKNNWITNIGSSDPSTSGTNFGIGIVSSSAAVDNIQIKDNQISQIRGGVTRSADGIAIGWSSGTEQITNLVIDNNQINDITSDTTAWPSGRGAYGILINHGTGLTGKTVGASVTNNQIFNLEGLWAHGIGLEGNTPEAQVTGNTIENLVDHKTPSDAVAVQIEDNAAANTILVQFNNFINVNVGVQNVAGILADATKNWWDDVSGPSGVGLGTGSSVTIDVTYDPWIGAKLESPIIVKPITSGDVDINFGPISVTAHGDVDGTGQIKVFNYAERPWTESPVFSGGSNFFNFEYTPFIIGDPENPENPQITQLDITFHNPGGSVIYWWDKGTETWAPCSNQVLNPDGSITVTVTATTTPNLNDLADPPFGGGTPLEVPAMSPIFLVSLFLGIVGFGYFFIGKK